MRRKKRTPFFLRVIYLYVIRTSGFRLLDASEVDSWECLLIIVPEPPIVLGTIAANRLDAEVSEWVQAMQNEAWQMCNERGLIAYREEDVVPHPELHKVSQQ